MARVLKGYHSFTCTPRVHLLTEWIMTPSPRRHDMPTSLNGKSLYKVHYWHGCSEEEHDKFVTETVITSRDGNRTEPEPNTPNSNTILRPFRTEPNEPKDFTNRTRTEQNHQVERTELNSNSSQWVQFPQSSRSTFQAEQIAMLRLRVGSALVSLVCT